MKDSRMRSRSRSVRSDSSNCPSRRRSLIMLVTIARIAASSWLESDRTEASTLSASIRMAASRVCGLGPAWRKRRWSTLSAASLAATEPAGAPLSSDAIWRALA